MIYINYLANAKPLGGITTGEISDKYNTLFTPSGFTFSIWGIIYILVFAFVIKYVMSSSIDIPNFTIIGALFIITCLINIGWLYSWHFDKILISTVVMILFLITLFITLKFTPQEGLIYATFSIYAGWISIALIANISILLFKYDVSLFMNYESFWFYAILVIGVAIGLYMAIVEKNYYYVGVYFWAYFGIAMKYIN
jgi:hypothetical protein